MARDREVDYSDEEMTAWAARVLEQGWDRAFVFFKHEDEGLGPKLAQRFVEAAGRLSPPA